MQTLIAQDQRTQVDKVWYYSTILYPVYQPRTYLGPSYFGTLGWALPAALGAKVACPGRAVVSISGDGGFLFNVQELATAVQYGIHVVAGPQPLQHGIQGNAIAVDV